jgi:hypothetical protein
MTRLVLLVGVGVLSAIACSNGDGTPVTQGPGEAKPKGPPGPRAEGPGFVAEVVPTETSAAVGTPGTARVTLKPTGVYHVNKEFPISLEVTPPEGVELVSKPKQEGEDAAKLAEEGATFDVKYVGKAPGPKAFTAVFKFAVCTPKTCDPKKETLAWNIEVK